MKVVLLHDWLTGFRGGERVLEALCEMFPDAPIYTLLHDKGSTSEIIESREIVTSFLDKIPGIYCNYRKFLPLMPLAAQSLKILHKADLIISSSHCVIKGVRKPSGAKHICYIHSPMRYIYDQFDNYFDSSPLPVKTVAHLVRPYLQWWDKKSNKNVDLFIANSNFVKRRIDAFYGPNLLCKVIHPFVDDQDFHTKEISKKENFYLMVTAFAPNKRVDIAIDAFNYLGLTLKLVGDGSKEEVQKLKSKANKNIEFLGNLPRSEVVQLFSRAKAFIFPGVEDFGITPLEAMISKTPVVAYRAGGVLETLTDDTAIFFDEPTKDSLIKAIEELQYRHFSSEKMVERAALFSKEAFKKNLLAEITNI